MVYSIKVEQLIHVAVDAENGMINQHLLIKLLEFIVRRSNIHTLNVVFNENDKSGSECCKYIEACKANKTLPVDEISEYITSDETKSKEISEELTLDPVCNAFEYPNLNKNQDEWTTPTNQPVKTALHKEVATSTEDFYDDSSLDCDSVESFEGSPESIYKLPSEETISESELLKKEVDQISVSSSLNLDQFLEEKHEYHLQTNDIHVIADIIEQLYGKINKVNKVIGVLQNSIHKYNTGDSDGSEEFDVFKEIAFSDMGSPMEIEKRGYDRSKLDENLYNLDLSSKGEVFKTIFGRTQKRKDLNLALSVGNFRELDLDYRTNFKTIHIFIEKFIKSIDKLKSDIEQIQKSSLDKEEFIVFQNAISSSHNKMKNDIKEHILKDPEAMGIVRFVKDGSCMSCGKSAMMKTTNTAPICAEKDAPTRSSSRKSLQDKRGKTNTPPRVKFSKNSIIDVPTGIKCNVIKLPAKQPKCSPKTNNWGTKLKRFENKHEGDDPCMSSKPPTQSTNDVEPTKLKFSVINLPAEKQKYIDRSNWDAKLKIFEKRHEGEPIKQNAIKTYRLMYKEPKRIWI